MAQKTKIKRDFLGLYVDAGNWISRPFYGTCFNEGDIVKSHHFGGSTSAGVGELDANFRKDRGYEYWCTTGIINWEYENRKNNDGEILSEEEYNKVIKESTKWYFDHETHGSVILSPINKEYALSKNKVWKSREEVLSIPEETTFFEKIKNIFK